MLKKWSGTATEGRASTGCNKQQPPRHGEMVPHKTREDPDTFFFSVSSNLISYFFENQNQQEWTTTSPIFNLS
jgi:hypothetical protein